MTSQDVEILASKRPGPKTMPTDITSQGKKIWAEFWKTYGKHCREYGTQNEAKFDDAVDGTWSMARIIFRKYAEKRNIQPYARSAMSKTESDTVSKRIFNASKKLTKKVKVILGIFKRKDLLAGTKVLKETLESINYVRGNFVIKTKFAIKVNSNDINLRDIFNPKGYTSKNKQFLLILGQDKLVFDNTISRKKLNGSKHIILTKQQVKSILELDNISIKNNKLVIKELGKHIKTDVLNDDESSVGKHLTAKLEILEPVTWENSVGIDFAQDLDDDSVATIFQYHFTLMLADVAQAKGESIVLWDMIVKDPTEFLDPLSFEEIETNEEEEEE